MILSCGSMKNNLEISLQPNQHVSKKDKKQLLKDITLTYMYILLNLGNVPNLFVTVLE